MEFFNKKEEVLDIQLTQFGKNLLSMGKFKPSYYAFFDDEIVYDSEYAGFYEEVGDAQDRIKNETPNTKVQYVYYGVETNFQKAKKLLRKDKEPLAQELQATPDKHYALSAPLGNSLLSSEYAPSWNVQFLDGETTGQVHYKTGSHPTLRIPQLEISPITYKTYPQEVKKQEDGTLPSAGNTSVNNPIRPLAANDLSRGSEGSDLNFSVTRFSDGSFIRTEADTFIISVDEENAPLLRKNFDIEVFVEEIDPDTGQEVYTQLFFDKKKEMIDENNVLLDPDPNDMGVRGSLLDTSFVNHFFHIYVDDEINKDLLCKLVPRKEREISFPPNFLDCDDLDRVDDTLVVDNTDLYDSDVDPSDIDDKC